MIVDWDRRMQVCGNMTTPSWVAARYTANPTGGVDALGPQGRQAPPPTSVIALTLLTWRTKLRTRTTRA